MDQTKLPEQQDEGRITEALIKQVAAMSASGAKKSEIRRQFNLSQYYIDKIYNDELFKQLVEGIGDEAIFNARLVTKRELAKLAGLAVKAINENLKKHSLAAAQVVLKAIGLDGSNKEEEKNTGFTLVLANQKKEEVIKVVDAKDE